MPLGEPVTEREWKMSLDSHLREHEIDSRHREQLAKILDSYREEARDANSLRLEGMNEFRRQLDRQANTFVTNDAHDALAYRVSQMVTREVYDSQSKAGADAIAAIGIEVSRRIGAVENKQSNMDGRMAVYGLIAALVGSGVTSLIVYAVTK